MISGTVGLLFDLLKNVSVVCQKSNTGPVVDHGMHTYTHTGCFQLFVRDAFSSFSVRFRMRVRQRKTTHACCVRTCAFYVRMYAYAFVCTHALKRILYTFVFCDVSWQRIDATLIGLENITLIAPHPRLILSASAAFWRTSAAYDFANGKRKMQASFLARAP